MEFHDILHGIIRFSDENLTALLADLIDSPEIHRLRNMRQMNFDVPLIQELGRSRRLPHSIGVTYLAVELAHNSNLGPDATKALLAAAILHDAAIPPYGHLVESELKRVAPNFNHEETLSQLIRGVIGEGNDYEEIVPGKQLQLAKILRKHNVDQNAVISLVCPKKGTHSAVSADIDIDNIDNVHRMAAMLGWDKARENIVEIRKHMRLNNKSGLSFGREAIKPLQQWLDFRQRIYTMIIAHPECIPYNALQTDLVRLAVDSNIITPENWYMTEPEFEERLRQHESTKLLAQQLISGCEYHLVDYVWFKNFNTSKKLKNAEIAEFMAEKVKVPFNDSGYFVWNEKSLICREIKISIDNGSEIETLGENSTSCMVALIKKTQGKAKLLKKDISDWRDEATTSFINLFEVDTFEAEFPETYKGSFFAETDELHFELN
ncbi:HD domain-containing protein [Pseudomonas sp. SED1]|uniref:HD domain-containing protein n=1 Tax=Pseudomonas sp. SED1 TaxID=3056845 RepID=UPI00296E656C|nr:HD domain-containing protein [Pseudomonas sp. SED1]MDY0834336.1 HD domain-containing protein [Pseudomonas sp. SED1]